jgi:hypothetical protein
MFYLIKNDNDDFETRVSDIDASRVDYLKGVDTFEIGFDKNLYEPPKIIIENERRIAEIAERSKNNNKK